ncbi:hypothetical protein ACJJTC_012328 [Scirpophaga incertulas]
MPKRRNSRDSEECISRKIRKLERKLKRRLKRNKRILCSSSDSPGPVLTPECRSLQEALEYKQRSISAAISCLSRAMSHVLTQPNRDPQVVKQLIETGCLLCDIQYESMNRRRFICSAIKKEVREHLFDTEIDTYLFGEKLPETVKAAKAINKSGTELRSALAVQKSAPVTKKASTTVPLNSRPQLGSRVQPPTRRRFESAPGPSPHSTRHASTSRAARLGINIDTIRATAGWTGTSTVFAKFYNRSVCENSLDDFSTAILNSTMF